MASTNVTNIKNAFTLSNTLGGNAGNLTSFDPSLLKTPYDFIILKQIPITVSSSLTEVTTTSQGITTTTKGTTNVVSGAEPLYYNSGFYSTDSVSNDTKQKGTKIELIIKQFLDKAFNSFLYTLSRKDIVESKVTEIKINFASQESAIPNSDSEQAGNPPPGGKPITPPIDGEKDHVGNLARARYAWCRWYIEDYIKNIKNNNAITSASKKALEGISDEDIFKALKIEIEPRILLGFTPFSNTTLAEGAPQDSKYGVPLYFRNGTANQNLLNNGSVSPQMSQTGKSVQALQDELKSRYNSEQKSLIIFYAKIENYKTERKCDLVGAPAPGAKALPPDFIVEQPVGSEVNDKIYIQGMALQIPDRFGNLRHFSSTLPYHERIIYGIVLRLIDLTFPGSEAFKDIDYISSFDSNQIPSYPKDKQTSNKNLYDLFKDSFYITNYGGLTNVLITSLYQFQNPAYPFDTLYWIGGNVLSLIERGVMTGTGESDDQKFKPNRTLVDFYIKGFGVAKSQMTSDYPNIYLKYSDLLTYAHTPSYYFYTTENQPENLINNFTSNKFDISGNFKKFCDFIGNKIVKVEGYNDTPQLLPEDGIFNSFDGNKNNQHEFLYDSLPPTYKNQKIYPIYNCFNSSNYYVRRKCKF